MNSASLAIASSNIRPTGVVTLRHELLCFLLGLTVAASSPPEDTASYLRLPLLGSYHLTYFDLIVLAAFLVCFWNAELKLGKVEARVYRALGFVVLTRVISLVFASEVMPQQMISVFRYVETLVILIILTNVLASGTNRRRFLAGVILGAALESLGGLVIFFSTHGEYRAIWLGRDNYKIQVYALLVCCLALVQSKQRLFVALSASALGLAIIATQTRRAISLFLVALAVIVWKRRRQLLRPMLATLGICAIVAFLSFLSFSVLPETGSGLSGRVDQMWTGGGTVGLRIILWEMAAEAYLRHPITGIGSGGFARQQDALYFKIADAYDPGYEHEFGTLSTHNTVLGVAAETGTLGLIAYFLWFFAVVSLVWKVLDLVHEDKYIVAACACLLSMVLEDLWGQASFLPTMTCLLGLVLGWYRAKRLACLGDAGSSRQLKMLTLIPPNRT
jgi:O-antigen ligase